MPSLTSSVLSHSERATTPTDDVTELPRLVADALQAPAVVFLAADGTGSMIDLDQRRSVFAPPAPTAELLQLGLIVPGTVVGGMTAWAVEPVRDAQGGRLGTIAVFDRGARAATVGELSRLREIADVVADQMDRSALPVPTGSTAIEPVAVPTTAAPTAEVEDITVVGLTGADDDITVIAPRQTLESAPLSTARVVAPMPRAATSTETTHESAISSQVSPAQPLRDAGLVRVTQLGRRFVDDVAGATDVLHGLLDAIDSGSDQVLHRHSAEVRERFKVVEQTSERLEQARRELPGSEAPKGLVDLRPIVDEAVRLTESSVAGCRIDVSSQDGPLSVMANPAAVRRAVTLMLSSAVEAAADHRVHVHLEVQEVDSDSIHGRLSVELGSAFQGRQLGAAQMARLASRFLAARSDQGVTGVASCGTMILEAGERVLTVPGFQIRSGAEHTTMVAEWPLDLG